VASRSDAVQPFIRWVTHIIAEERSAEKFFVQIAKEIQGEIA